MNSSYSIFTVHIALVYADVDSIKFLVCMLDGLMNYSTTAW